MSNDTEVDMKDVELNELEQEKQPMTAGEAGNGDAGSPTATEKNGSVKVKLPEETETKFTGLSKEELMKVAGTPGWVRTRWALLILFWLGWLGMLAGAIAIIVQAPRCKPLPTMNWWNYGALYQIGDVRSFSGDLKGLKDKIASLGELKVKGLVVGPIHEAPADQAVDLNFEQIASQAGTLDQFKDLIGAAHKKSISVVLDLTPNYRGQEPWFSNGSVTAVVEQLKSALVFWLKQGVDGVQLSGVERISNLVPLLWADIRAIVQNATEDGKRKVLIGVTERTSAVEVSDLLNRTGVDLLLSGVLRSSRNSGTASAQAIEQLYSNQTQTQLAWNLGDRTHGHLASLVGSNLVKLNQLLLLTLPGTPVFNYGDEIGLEDQDTKFPNMVWDSSETAELNVTLKLEMDTRLALRSFFKTLADLRSNQLSLKHGDYVPLLNNDTSLAFLRQWDQSKRYVAAFNWGSEATALRLAHEDLPEQATVSVSSDAASLAPDSSVDLAAVQLGPGQAVLLHFPHTF